MERAARLGRELSPLEDISVLLRQSNIPIEIVADVGQKILARKNGGEPFSIAELSDGERSALLIGGDVLTAPSGSLIIIDEPEKHIHRSISAPLLNQLFQRRPDCAFVISTHELELPIDNPGGQILLVRSCVFQGKIASAWEADLVDNATEIGDDLKRDLIGARKKVVFVEGGRDSLDEPLYSILFPNVSVIGKENCRDVQYAVKGVHSTSAHNWVSAWGIVDRDGHSDEYIDKMKSENVHAVPFYSVESIYYHSKSILMAARAIATVQGGDGDAKAQEAIVAALQEVGRHSERMSVNGAEKLAKRSLFAALPTSSSIRSKENVDLTIDVSAILRAKTEELEADLARGDWAAVIARCPIRQTRALDIIASTVGFSGRDKYEEAVRRCLEDNEEFKNDVRSFFDGLYVAVTT